MVKNRGEEVKKILISMGDTYPNDSELGTNIRKLINELKKKDNELKDHEERYRNHNSGHYYYSP
jgi:hypothetical protein|tara:strand:- start:1083 stop:1274 length:192 start_codon:yes stop_codon:yes gene_type:complete